MKVYLVSNASGSLLSHANKTPSASPCAFAVGVFRSGQLQNRLSQPWPQFLCMVCSGLFDEDEHPSRLEHITVRHCKAFGFMCLGPSVAAYVGLPSWKFRVAFNTMAARFTLLMSVTHGQYLCGAWDPWLRAAVVFQLHFRSLSILFEMSCIFGQHLLRQGWQMVPMAANVSLSPAKPHRTHRTRPQCRAERGRTRSALCAKAQVKELTKDHRPDDETEVGNWIIQYRCWWL